MNHIIPDDSTVRTAERSEKAPEEASVLLSQIFRTKDVLESLGDEGVRETIQGTRTSVSNEVALEEAKAKLHDQVMQALYAIEKLTAQGRIRGVEKQLITDWIKSISMRPPNGRYIYHIAQTLRDIFRSVEVVKEA